MIMQAANQCSYLFTAYQFLVGGLLSSLGFIINMVVVGGVVRWYMRKKQENPDGIVKAVVEKMLANK